MDKESERQQQKILNFGVDLSLAEVMPLLDPVYPEEYFQTSKQLYRMLQNQQYTQQANQLAEVMISHLESNYNCWLIKKMCIKAGVTTPQKQLNYSKKILLGKVKNFQIWEFRRFLTEITKNYKSEFQLVEEVLKIEYKNYHAWSYRIWLTKQAKNWQEQLENVNKHIKNDENNNSAWAYRFFVINQFAKQSSSEVRKKIYSQQILSVVNKLYKSIQNEALWNYLRGFFPAIKLKDFPQHTPAILSYDQYPEILALCKKIIQQTKDEKSIQALITCVFVESQDQSTREYAKNVCQILSIRQKQKETYWKWVRQSI